MRIAGIQLSVSMGTRDENVAMAGQKVYEAARAGARIICLQEYFATGFFPKRMDRKLFSLAEEVTGPTVSHFASLAEQLKVWIIIPFFEQDQKAGERYYNSAAVVNPDGQITGVYRKNYCVLRDGAFEQYYFSPGNTGPAVFRTDELSFGICICDDRHFFEIPRGLVLSGADVIFTPSSTYRAPGRSNVWRAELVSMAANNAAYVMGVNSAGLQEGRDQFGHSVLVDPFGEVMAELGEEEGILVGDISNDQVHKSRLTFFLMRDVRRDVLDELLELYDR